MTWKFKKKCQSLLNKCEKSIRRIYACFQMDQNPLMRNLLTSCT